MNILIVEDSKTQAERLKNILEEQGYQVNLAIHGADALNQINLIDPQLVITDIMMPIMNGYELCKQLRLDDRFKQLPIILLTTLSETEDIVKGLECGANYFIIKPYEEEYLLEQIRTTVNLHKIRLAEPKSHHVKILCHGNEHIISAEKEQILDLLISIYDTIIQKNHELYDARLQVQNLNASLEKKVADRTADLRIEIDENTKLYDQLKIHTLQL